jgi:hypothetical protein
MGTSKSGTPQAISQTLAAVRSTMGAAPYFLLYWCDQLLRFNNVATVTGTFKDQGLVLTQVFGCSVSILLTVSHSWEPATN